MTNICVVGAGYVGLVTAGCLAEAGNNVISVDRDEGKIESLKKGLNPIYEPGLGEIIRRNQSLGRLSFTTDLKQGIDKSLVIFLAVGTPSAPDGSADISAVLKVAATIAENMTDYRIIVTKSTVPVGTHKKVTELIKSKTKVKFDYVSNPEFLKEGSAVGDFLRPDRVIIGTDSSTVKQIMKQLYDPFMRKSKRFVFMDPASAEMTKYAANTMLATRISFINEISALCEKLGADVEMVRAGIGSDSRIGSAFLFPGVGFGGSCFPKDIKALLYTANRHGIEMSIAKAAYEANLRQQERFAKRILDYFAGRADKTTLAVWGLAFKAKTNDVRCSPAIYCIRKFLAQKMKIKAYDPEAGDAAVKELDGGIEIFTNGYEPLNGADGLVIFTDWQEFRNPDFAAIAEKLAEPVIFDGKNLYEPKMVKRAGLKYYSVGREAVL